MPYNKINLTSFGTVWQVDTISAIAQTLLRSRFKKGQCYEMFDDFVICFKDSTWASYKQAKTVSQTFSFLQRYSIAKF